MEFSSYADLAFEQLGGGAHLERLYLPEIASVVVDRTRRIALPDTDLADCQLFNVQEHSLFALMAGSADSATESYYMSHPSDVKEGS